MISELLKILTAPGKLKKHTTELQKLKKEIDKIPNPGQKFVMQLKYKKLVKGVFK